MLATILFILKIIGLVLLGLLGLLLVLLLLILLVPVQYRAEGSFGGALKVRAGVSWLLHILSVQITFEKELAVCVRVFGVRLKAFGRDEVDAPDETQPEPDAGREAAPGEKPGWDAPDVPKPSDVPGTAKPSEAETGKPQPEDRVNRLSEEERRAAKQRREKASQKQPPRDEPDRPGPLDKLQMTIREICDKLESLKQKKDSWEAFLKQEENRRTFRLVWRQLRRLLCHLLPRKLEGRIRFGFDDPYKTGQILTYISPFYGLYAKHLELIPVFDEPVMEGELRLKGRVRIGTVLVLAIRVFMDKNFRKLLGRLRKG